MTGECEICEKQDVDLEQASSVFDLWLCKRCAFREKRYTANRDIGKEIAQIKAMIDAQTPPWVIDALKGRIARLQLELAARN